MKENGWIEVTDAALTHLRKMVEWLSMLLRAASLSGHFFLSSTLKNMALQSFLSSDSFPFSSLVPAAYPSSSIQLEASLSLPVICSFSSSFTTARYSSWYSLS